MLDLDDPRWTRLEGGYRQPYDPRPVFARLKAGRDISTCWDELWEELHHQGDVGLASYASIPHLAEIATTLEPDDATVFTLVGTIALVAGKNQDPPVPDWLLPSYSDALRRLADVARERIAKLTDPQLVRSCLGLTALTAGLSHHAKLLLHFDDAEVGELFGSVW
jgi:hypothetical protein